jgi:hypothetical protein
MTMPELIGEAPPIAELYARPAIVGRSGKRFFKDSLSSRNNLYSLTAVGQAPPRAYS